MDQQPPPARTTINTDLSGFRLVELTPDDAPAYYQLVDRNRQHLTQHGDYAELGHATLAAIQQSLSDPHDTNAKFGLWLADTLIGRADLSPRQPGHLVLGYWLGQAYTGRGYATIACRALIQYGREFLGATTFFAGVTKGNVASEALLHRLGFHVSEDRGSYTLFTLE